MVTQHGYVNLYDKLGLLKDLEFLGIFISIAYILNPYGNKSRNACRISVPAVYASKAFRNTNNAWWIIYHWQVEGPAPAQGRAVVIYR